MRVTWKLVLLVLVGASCPLTARAGWGVGVTIGGPYYRPYYGYHPYYYRPYPYYVVPPPIVIESPPVIRMVPSYAPPEYAPPVPAVSGETAPPPALPIAVTDGGEVGQQLAQLNAADPQTRANAAVQLGRMKARRAIDPLIRVLGSDSSPQVREAAARALGLIGAPGGLAALQRAAQSDDDREVRHSAQFAAEGIRVGLRGQ